jgi:hypothetical protein
MLGSSLQVPDFSKWQSERHRKARLMFAPHRLAAIIASTALSHELHILDFLQFSQGIPPMTKTSLWYAPAKRRPEAGKLMLAY